MRSQGTVALLLISAGCLIYAATHQPRAASPMQSNERGTEAPARLAYGVGPAEPRFAADMLDARVERMLDRAVHRQPAHQGTSRFVCKLPADVGPVPMLELVDAYLRGLPDSRRDSILLGGLHEAARQGNWLAKVQVLLSQGGRHAADDTSAFRRITLKEWMQEQRIGAVYAAAGNAPPAARARRARPSGALTSLDIYAAMHHNYPSQYKVGRELLRSGDAQQAAVGRRMLDCAARALPVYRQMHRDRALAAR
ncbi:hypothetical protein [Massilia sp. METH4]|uniref:hypothetical protein n=1 Tax=Massilia sp. METH4 TaxID=3123041 RepID=UPI0030CC4FF6